MPCDLSCDKRYKRWFIYSSILFTYAAVERLEVVSIPSNVAWVTGSTAGMRRNIEMPRGRPMENNFFCFISVDSSLVSSRPGTNIIVFPTMQCLWCCHRGRAIARVHPVHRMNVERRQAATDLRPSQTIRLWVRLYRLLESTPTIAIYYYSSRKLIFILPSHRG